MEKFFFWVGLEGNKGVEKKEAKLMAV